MAGLFFGLMRIYVTNADYLRACWNGAPRLDLEGNPDGAVTADQASNAVTILARRAGAKQPAPVKAAPAAPDSGPKRITLSDLKQAALRQEKASAPSGAEAL